MRKDEIVLCVLARWRLSRILAPTLCNVHTTVRPFARLRTQGAKNSARTRGFAFNVSSKSAPVKSRTSLDALTGEMSDKEAVRRVKRAVLENIAGTGIVQKRNSIWARRVCFAGWGGGRSDL